MSMHPSTPGTGSPVGYDDLCANIGSLIADDDDLISVMANVAAAIYQNFNLHWVGFYRVLGPKLVLGPFQGPIACSRIDHNKGVCGTAWAKARTLLVPNVDEFPGHIACSALSRSELVVPVCNRDGEVIAVLDIDHVALNGLTDDDARGMERIAAMVGMKA